MKGLSRDVIPYGTLFVTVGVDMMTGLTIDVEAQREVITAPRRKIRVFSYYRAIVTV